MTNIPRMRKGIMFSIILFFLAVSLVGLIAIQRSLISYRRERINIEMRIKSLNNMYDSLVRDAGSTLDTGLRRAMNAAFNNVSAEGIPLSRNANDTLQELVLDGTFDGVAEDLMENATFPYWIERIEQVGVLKGFYINITLYTLEIRPYDSFNLLAEAQMDVNITDMQGVAALNRSTLVEKLVSVEGLEDPLYPLNTGGRMTNMIERSSYIGNYTQLLLTGSDYGCTVICYEYGTVTNDTTFPNFQNKILVVDDADSVANLNSAKAVVSENPITVGITIPYVVRSGAKNNVSDGMEVLVDVNPGVTGRVWYIENFKEHVDNSYYQPSITGASYLDRLEGEIEIQSKYSSQTNNMIGLESFIDKSEIPSEIPVDADRTNIDYLYFSSGPDGKQVKGVSTGSNWFRIDDIDGRQQNYSVDQIIIN